jgi:hypothetical protein
MRLNRPRNLKEKRVFAAMRESSWSAIQSMDVEQSSAMAGRNITFKKLKMPDLAREYISFYKA